MAWPSIWMAYRAARRRSWPIRPSNLARLAALWPELADIRPDVAEQLEIEARYAGYLERQEADIRAFRRDESLSLAR